MNLLSVNQLSKSYGTKVLFKHISFGINHGEKVALVAQNGAGKTTLFKILKGIEIPDEGQVVFRKNLQVAFLDQNPQHPAGERIRDILKKADNPFVRCIEQYERSILLAESDPTAYQEALTRMNELDAWNYEKDAKEILGKLEITELDQPFGDLSGGQQKRVALALVLINRPELLIMDEPTNHLDVEMIEWLEHFLHASSISLLLVTHDRYFLEEVCERIIELEGGEIHEYRGNASGTANIFEWYLEKKAEREQAKNAEIDKAKNLYRREIEWVRRMPKARGTKSKSRLQAFEEIRVKARQQRVQKRIELSVKMERLGSKTVELHNVSKTFGKKKILDHFSYTFINGEKIGVVGKNGAGKSTLLRILLGELSPDQGKVAVGDTVVFGYYSQSGIQLNDDKRLIEVVKEIAEFIPMASGMQLSASQLLTRFNFPPEQQYSYVSKLSGGEKRRLYLLTVLVKNPNFLILDEPTNDLDIVTLQTLEEFLDDFPGCVLIVSHDRYFMDRLVDHLFAFEGNGQIKDFPGNYSDYRAWKTEQAEIPANPPGAALTEHKPDPISKDPSPKKLSYKQQRELEQLEQDIPILEIEKSSLEEKLGSGIIDYEEIRSVSEKLQKVQTLLDEKTQRWMEIQEELQ